MLLLADAVLPAVSFAVAVMVFTPLTILEIVQRQVVAV